MSDWNNLIEEGGDKDFEEFHSLLTSWITGKSINQNKLAAKIHVIWGRLDSKKKKLWTMKLSDCQIFAETKELIVMAGGTITDLGQLRQEKIL